MSLIERITVDPNVLVGKPVVKGTRLSVDFILDLLAQGWSSADIRKSYPGIEQEDILACLEYATAIIRSERVYLNEIVPNSSATGSR
jgi:uncharacterized protein (DUF433 family)